MEDEINEPELIVQPPPSEIALREKPPAKRKTAKIPALSFPTADSDSEDENSSQPKRSKVTAAAKDRKTGLFALLPAPKTSNQLFLPKVLSSVPPCKKTAPSVSETKKNTLASNSLLAATASVTAEPRVEQVTNSKMKALVASVDSSDEEQDNKNFFSFGDARVDAVSSTSSACASVSIGVSANDHWTSETVVSNRLKPDVAEWDSGNVSLPVQSNNSDERVQIEEGELSSTDWGEAAGNNAAWGEADYGDSEEQQNLNETNFQDEQFLRMQGRRNRGEEINIIDICGVDAPSALELSKNITEEVDLPPSHNNKDGPTSQQRRKHQITFLAHQAKEREFQLKNQWAENKFAKRQAQSKYGF
jgi:proline-rich protein PRCC